MFDRIKYVKQKVSRMVGGATFSEAILATVHLATAYQSVIQAYEGHCMVAGTPHSGYYIKVMLGKRGGADLLPTHVQGVTVDAIQ
jgi:hypothetical protein